MRKQTQFARRRPLQEQSAEYLNESELPFTVPLYLTNIDSDRFVARPAAIDGAPPRHKV